MGLRPDVGSVGYIQEIPLLCCPVSNPAEPHSNLTKLHYLNLVCCIQPGIKMRALACTF